MSHYKKYPRTYHLPWSEGTTSDDKVLRNVANFEGKEVVVTEKLDGENSNLYQNYYHARSIDSKSHPSRNWLKMFHSSIAHNIPEQWRLCGENVYAKHSIYYEGLTSYFYLFSIWNEENVCLSWNETLEWATLLGVEIVPVLYQGVFDEKVIKELYTKQSRFRGEQEGYVVRLADRFHFNEFRNSVAKFVRKNHVQTSNHWLNEEVVPNKLEK